VIAKANVLLLHLPGVATCNKSFVELTAIDVDSQRLMYCVDIV
jgi:hypothetical protein